MVAAGVGAGSVWRWIVAGVQQLEYGWGWECKGAILASGWGLPPHGRLCAIHMALPALPLQALSNTLWGLSKLGIQAPQLMEGIGQEARSQLIEFNSQNLANSVGGWVAGGLVDAVSCVSLGVVCVCCLWSSTTYGT